MSFTVLFVCTGNICRSPAAELLFRARLPLDAGVAVSSAGTHGLEGHAVDAPTAAALREIGIDPSGHRGRRLNVDLLRSADLVLTAAGHDRAIVLQADPLLMHRTFTLREFARLATNDPGHSSAGNPTTAELRAQVAEIAARRGSAAPAGAGENDIADPFGASISVARATVTAISTHVDAALDGLNLNTDHTAR